MQLVVIYNDTEFSLAQLAAEIRKKQNAGMICTALIKGRISETDQTEGVLAVYRKRDVEIEHGAEGELSIKLGKDSADQISRRLAAEVQSRLSGGKK